MANHRGNNSDFLLLRNTYLKKWPALLLFRVTIAKTFFSQIFLIDIIVEFMQKARFLNYSLECF